ncbi:hypothetical protein EDB85DRAFT_1893048 [Lactarius pseudohatsudake]|nr:hypothetical protein EDB85DRAFT_1893048 [Lactarius pseudohatsudake]
MHDSVGAVHQDLIVEEGMQNGCDVGDSNASIRGADVYQPKRDEPGGCAVCCMTVTEFMSHQVRKRVTEYGGLYGGGGEGEVNMSWSESETAKTVREERFWPGNAQLAERLLRFTGGNGEKLRSLSLSGGEVWMWNRMQQARFGGHVDSSQDNNLKGYRGTQIVTETEQAQTQNQGKGGPNAFAAPSFSVPYTVPVPWIWRVPDHVPVTSSEPPNTTNFTPPPKERTHLNHTPYRTRIAE